jgi:amidase
MVAAGVVSIAHATDGGGSIRIPAGVDGNIGVKASRGVFSIAPHLSDLTGFVSIQGCQSRSVPDTAAFVDACRGPAPGEFMPYWTAPEPYTELIVRDPPQLRIAISHQWGDYRATPQIASELERVGCFKPQPPCGIRLPAVDYRAAFAAQTTCYVRNFAVEVRVGVGHVRFCAGFWTPATTRRSARPTGWRPKRRLAGSVAIFVIALSVRPMWLAA